MKKFALAVMAVTALSISAAYGAEWRDGTNEPAFQKVGIWSKVWIKEEEDQNCLLAITKTGHVGATIFRGSILRNDLNGQWHLAEYNAPDVQYVKERGLRVHNMYGNMVVGMEMVDLNAFKRQCDGLPPL